jgi:hypothetical protein
MSEQQNFAASSYPLPRIYNLPNAIATYWCRGLLEQHFASMLMTRTSSWIALRNPTFGKLLRCSPTPNFDSASSEHFGHFNKLIPISAGRFFCYQIGTLCGRHQSINSSGRVSRSLRR